MHFTITTAISLFSIITTASPAALQTRNIDSGFWQLSTKPIGDSSAIGVPIVLGFFPDNSPVISSTGAAGEVLLCIQLLRTVDAEGVPTKGAIVINHPTINEVLYMWKSEGLKSLVTSTRVNVGTANRGNWTFVQDPYSTDLILDCDGETMAKRDLGIYFGSKIPPTVVGELVSIVGIPVDAC